MKNYVKVDREIINNLFAYLNKNSLVPKQVSHGIEHSSECNGRNEKEALADYEIIHAILIFVDEHGEYSGNMTNLYNELRTIMNRKKI